MMISQNFQKEYYVVIIQKNIILNIIEDLENKS